MQRVLLAATLLSSTACFGQQGTCYTDYAGNAHCQGSDGSSGSTYQVGPITHYQWNPGSSAQSQQELQQQLLRNRQVRPNYGATQLGQTLGGECRQAVTRRSSAA